jgi:peptidoglycan/xylan/chitin deacetylase (PgdA/CDA1 family)
VSARPPALQPSAGWSPLWRAGLQGLSPAGERARLSIVLFHRVFAEPDPMFPDEMHRARFDTLCGWLARWYRVLPLDEAARRLADGSLPARALCITFDDGYADNHDVALPVLQRHGLPATFFIATNFLDGGRMWNDTVVESVRRCQADRVELSGLSLPLEGAALLTGWDQRRHWASKLLGVTKYLPPAERLDAVSRIAQRFGATLPDDLMMSTAQLRAMAAAGMQIGAHTMSHPILATLDDAAAAREITLGKSRLEALLDQPVTLFAYPNGRPRTDYLPRDVALVRGAGFAAAVSTAAGAAGPGPGDPFQLPRFTPWDHQRTRFGLRMARNYFTRADRV